MKSVKAKQNSSGNKQPPSNGVHHNTVDGTKPMPRVGGHTSNITPSQGVPGGPGVGGKNNGGC